MAIDELGKIPGLNPENSAILQDLLNKLHIDATGIVYLTSVPTDIPFGKMAIVDDGTTQSLYIKSGKGTLKEVGGGFVTGDWIISSVATAHSGWTNVSATYSNKFMRINATPLTTGGADTHTTPSHTLTTAEMPAHNHDWEYKNKLGGGTLHQSVDPTAGNVSDGTSPIWKACSAGYFRSKTAGSGGGHTHTAADNVPAYVQVVIFQKD